jgi:Tol biopolymer transport system component
VLAVAAPAFAGRIAYSSGAPSQVFSVPAGGGPVQQITHDPAGAAHPDWSRDGRLVAYDVGGARLAVANADGSGEHFITIEMSAIDPSWSPDSSQLAFTGVQYDDHGNAEDTSLYVTQADGSNYVRIGDGSEPDWSPAGDWIVYRSNPADSDGCPGIWRKRPDGSDNSPLAPGTPDGSACAGGGSRSRQTVSAWRSCQATARGSSPPASTAARSAAWCTIRRRRLPPCSPRAAARSCTPRARACGR